MYTSKLKKPIKKLQRIDCTYVRPRDGKVIKLLLGSYKDYPGPNYEMTVFDKP